jgi:hypothetical protein
MTRFLLMCPAAVLLTLSPESAVALRMRDDIALRMRDDEGCGFETLLSWIFRGGLCGASEGASAEASAEASEGASAEASEGASEESSVALQTVTNGNPLVVLPTNEWPFDHAAVLATMEIGPRHHGNWWARSRATGDERVRVLQQNLGGTDVFDRIAMNTYTDTKATEKIRGVRTKMDLYMALYGWPHLLVAMKKSPLKIHEKVKDVPQAFEGTSPLSGTFQVAFSNGRMASTSNPLQQVNDLFTELGNLVSSIPACVGSLMLVQQDDIDPSKLMTDALQDKPDSFDKDKWSACANAILKRDDRMELIDQLSKLHMGFDKKIRDHVGKKTITVMQDWNQETNGSSDERPTRYAFNQFFFPSEEKMRDLADASSKARWMKNECATVNLEAYAREWYQDQAIQAQLAKQGKASAENTVQQEIGFLALFDFHLYRSLVCSNEGGEDVKDIFGKPDESEKTKALQSLIQAEKPDLVFTQEYSKKLFGRALETYKATPGQTTAGIHWNPAKLHCEDALDDVKNLVENNMEDLQPNEGTLEALNRDKWGKKFNFVKCKKVENKARQTLLHRLWTSRIDKEVENGWILAVSYHGASDANADAGLFGKKTAER